MAQLTARDIQSVISVLEAKKGRPNDVSLGDVMHLAEAMADSLTDFLQNLDSAIYRDFADIAGHISAMKHEIGNLRAADMKHNRVPEAGRELDAIVEATEEATHTIMESAEAIMAADPGDADAYNTVVNDNVMRIFEACSFQDITGQRISKVVDTLAYIDDRVSTFVERLKLIDIEAEAAEETEADRRKRELILHGPQHKGEGVSQDDIDAMLAEEGATADDSSQDDIDKLFD